MSGNQEISTGDYVTYLKDPKLNGGLYMSVVETEGTLAKISYFDSTSTHKELWVDKADLQIVHQATGGFKNEGEG